MGKEVSLPPAHNHNINGQHLKSSHRIYIIKNENFIHLPQILNQSCGKEETFRHEAVTITLQNQLDTLHGQASRPATVTIHPTKESPFTWLYYAALHSTDLGLAGCLLTERTECLEHSVKTPKG